MSLAVGTGALSHRQDGIDGDNWRNPRAAYEEPTLRTVEVSLITAVHTARANHIHAAADSVTALRRALSVPIGARPPCTVRWWVVVDGPDGDILGRRLLNTADGVVAAGRTIGVASARNQALALALAGADESDWVFRLDGDDVVDVAGWIALLEDPWFGSAAWHATNLLTVDGERTPHWFDRSRWWEPGEVAERWTSPMAFHPGNVVARVDLVADTGGWPGLTVNEDLLFAFSLNEYAAGLGLPHVTLRYRRWAGQVVAGDDYLTRKAEAFRVVAAVTNARRLRRGMLPVTEPPPGKASLYTDQASETDAAEGRAAGPPGRDLPLYARAAVYAFTSNPFTETTFPQAGLAGQECAIVGTDADRTFVKWVSENADDVIRARQALAREASNLAAVGEQLPTACFYGFDEENGVLLTKALSGPTVERWDSGVLKAAGDVLDRVAATDPAKLPPRGATSHGQPPCFRGRFDDGNVLTLLGRGLGGDVAQHASDLLTLPRPVVGHADPHPANWLYHDGSLHLVDFDHIGTVPQGWDRVYLASHIAEEPTADSLVAWVLERAAPTEVAVMSGAIVFRMARGAALGLDTAWASHCRRTLPSALLLYSRLSRGVAQWG